MSTEEATRTILVGVTERSSEHLHLVTWWRYLEEHTLDSALVCGQSRVNEHAVFWVLTWTMSWKISWLKIMFQYYRTVIDPSICSSLSWYSQHIQDLNLLVRKITVDEERRQSEGQVYWRNHLSSFQYDEERGRPRLSAGPLPRLSISFCWSSLPAIRLSNWSLAVAALVHFATSLSNSRFTSCISSAWMSVRSLKTCTLSFPISSLFSWWFCRLPRILFWTCRVRCSAAHAVFRFDQIVTLYQV